MRRLLVLILSTIVLVAFSGCAGISPKKATFSDLAESTHGQLSYTTAQIDTMLGYVNGSTAFGRSFWSLADEAAFKTDLDTTFEAELDNSAGLLAALSDETGTGVAVFGTSPTITTPNIGNADTTLARSGAGDLTVEGNNIYRAGGTDVPIADGGTGSSTAEGAKAALDTDLPSKSFAVNAATASDDFLVWRAPVAITITDIYGVLQSGTNVIGALDECDSNGANCSAVDADITFDGSLDQDDGSLSNGTIDAGDWIKWHTTSVSSPGYLTITFEYTID